MKHGRWWGVSRWVAALVVGMLAGSVVLTPVGAHITTFNHLKAKHFYTKKVADAQFINIGEKASDADKLDGKDSTEFLGTAGKAADADKLDGVDSSAFQSKSHWALFQADGTIVAQSGGITLQTHAATGEYYIHFPVVVAGKAILAVGRLLGPNAFLQVDACGGPPLGITCSVGTNTTSHALVYIVDHANNLANKGFHVAVLS